MKLIGKVLKWALYVLFFPITVPFFVLRWMFRSKGLKAVDTSKKKNSFDGTIKSPVLNDFDLADAKKKIPILKREKRYSEAIDLLDKCVEATEAESHNRNIPVQSWPYLELAVIYKKLKDTNNEVKALERFAEMPNSGSKQSRKLLIRLGKASAKSSRATKLLSGRGVIVDCETTGLSKSSELIELALLSFDYNKASGEIRKVVDSYSGLREPNCPIPASATAKHGLTIDDVKGHRLDEKKCRQIIDSADVLVAHNASFDRRFVAGLFPEVSSKHWLCSMNGVKWAKHGHSSKALQSLLSDFSIKPESSHRAMADADSTLRLISKIDPNTKESYFSEMLTK